MEWFDQRYSQFLKEHNDRTTVAQNAEDIYAALWAAIMEVVRAAHDRGMQIQPNGFPLHHTLLMGKRLLRINLSEDKHCILASPGDSREVPLCLAVCEDGSVCLKHNGFTVNYAQAAQKIMEPFIFGGESPYAVAKIS